MCSHSNLSKLSRSVDGAALSQASHLVPPRGRPLHFHYASRVLLHPSTRTHVRLLGPCFKTGRLKPFRHASPGAFLCCAGTVAARARRHAQRFAVRTAAAHRRTGTPPHRRGTPHVARHASIAEHGIRPRAITHSVATVAPSRRYSTAPPIHADTLAHPSAADARAGRATAQRRPPRTPRRAASAPHAHRPE